MELDGYTEDRIDSYLTGRMTAAEKQAFEAEMAADEALKDEVAQQKLVMGAIINHRRQELKNWIKENTAEQEKKRGAGPIWMRIAAAFIIAAGAGLFVFVKQQRMQQDGNIAVNKPVDSARVNPLAPPSPLDKNSTGLSADSEKGNARNPSADKNLADNAPAKKGTQHGGDMGIEQHYDSVKISPDQDIWKFGDNTPQNASPNVGGYTTTGSSSAITLPRAYDNNANTYVWTGAARKMKSNQNFKDNGRTADTIKGDEWLGDSTISLVTIKTPDGKIADDRAKAETFVSNGENKKVKVSFFNSPLNFRGYKYYHKALTLYGVSKKAKLSVVSYKGATYLKMDKQYFLLNDQDYTYDFSRPVTDKTLLKELDY